MNKTQRRSIAKRLNAVITTMTEQEVYLARNSRQLGISDVEANRLIGQMSHNSSMLAEIWRDLVGIK